MEEISFDDLLGDHKPKEKISLRITKPTVATRRYTPPASRETKANWDTPKPEVVILFWSETVCDHCGEIHGHPTFAQNSTLVRYRVSRFRSMLRPYHKSNELSYQHLPRVRETTQSTVRYCIHCFDEHSPSLEEFDFVGPLEQIRASSILCSDIEKPFAEVDYTDSELHNK